jgi:nicotinamidase-related amidase
MELILDPKTTALVLIDLQKGIVGRETAPYPASKVIENAVRLANAFRAAGGTVIFVRVLMNEVLTLPVDVPRPAGALPPDASELLPDLDLLPSDIVVAKRQWGAFYETGLEQHLRRRWIRTIVLGGIATNFGVESTAREGFDRGYELVFAEDAMSSLKADAHNFAVKNIFPRMGRVRSTDEIMKSLQPESQRQG